MKNYKFLVPIILIALMAGSWYALLNGTIKKTNEYNSYLTAAREKADLGITKYAIENYKKALVIQDNIDVCVEVADYYKEHSNVNVYISWCESVFANHPKDGKAYDCLLQAYYSAKDYTSCYDTIYVAEKRNISTAYIKEINSKISYEYNVDYASYEDVKIYSNNYCAVKGKGLWGFVDRFGNSRVTCKYTSVGAFTMSGFASVVDESSNAFFIDKQGSKVMVAKEKFKEYGLLVDGILTAIQPDGKYIYTNDSFSKLFGDYDFASTLNNDIGIIKNMDSWSIIDSKGKIKNEKFDGFILDEKNIAYRNDRLFAKISSKYYLIDSSGKKITEDGYEEAKLFASEQYAAVKIGGKWGFIDKNGKLMLQAVYQDARSFINGMAAVKIGEKWGFIDESGTVVIQAQFYEAKDFNEKGSCFVKMGSNWQLIKLYRLNREE